MRQQRQAVGGAAGGLTALLRTTALEVAGDAADVADLVAAGHVDGSWAAFVEEVRTGVMLDAQPGASDLVGSEAVRAAATSFRYDRRLVSAAEFREWLRQRDLAADDLAGVLRRRLLRERATVRDLPAIGDGPAVADDEVAAVVRAEAICAGWLDRQANVVANWLLATTVTTPIPPGPGLLDRVAREMSEDHVSGTAALPEAELRQRSARMLSGRAAWAAFSAQAVTARALADALRRHALDWTEVAGEEACFATEGAGREARLLLQDGMSLEQLASRAGATTRPARRLVADNPSSGAALVSAPIGAAVGPWREEGSWIVMVVGEKIRPAADLPIAQRAREELVQAAASRLAAGRVRRHAAL